MCGSGKDEVLNRHENQDRSEGRGGGPLWFAALPLAALAMCGGGGGGRSGGKDRPTEAEARQVIDRQRKSLRLWIDSDRRRNGGEQRFAVLLPLAILAMCGGGGSDDPDDYGPPSFGPVRNYRRRGEAMPPDEHRGLFAVALRWTLRLLGRVGAVS